MHFQLIHFREFTVTQPTTSSTAPNGAGTAWWSTRSSSRLSRSMNPTRLSVFWAARNRRPRASRHPAPVALVDSQIR